MPAPRLRGAGRGHHLHLRGPGLRGAVRHGAHEGRGPGARRHPAAGGLRDLQPRVPHLQGRRGGHRPGHGGPGDRRDLPGPYGGARRDGGPGTEPEGRRARRHGLVLLHRRHAQQAPLQDRFRAGQARRPHRPGHGGRAGPHLAPEGGGRERHRPQGLRAARGHGDPHHRGPGGGGPRAADPDLRAQLWRLAGGCGPGKGRPAFDHHPGREVREPGDHLRAGSPPPGGPGEAHGHPAGPLRAPGRGPGAQGPGRPHRGHQAPLRRLHHPFPGHHPGLGRGRRRRPAGRGPGMPAPGPPGPQAAPPGAPGRHPGQGGGSPRPLFIPES